MANIENILLFVQQGMTYSWLKSLLEALKIQVELENISTQKILIKF